MHRMLLWIQKGPAEILQYLLKGEMSRMTFLDESESSDES